MKKMIDTKSVIDLNRLVNMNIQQQVQYLRFADMFNLIPEDKVNIARAFIDNATVLIKNKKSHIPVVINGGINKLASIVKENFKHVVRLSGYTGTELISDFINNHQISEDEYLVCTGRDHNSDIDFICFKNFSDATLAKLFFHESILLDNVTEDDISKAEATAEADKAQPKMIKKNIGSSRWSGGYDDGEDDGDCENDLTSEIMSSLFSSTVK